MFSPGHVIFWQMSVNILHMYGTSYIIKKNRWTFVKNEAGRRWNVHFLATLQFWVAWPHFEPYEKKTEIGRYLQILPICVQYIHVYFTCVSDVFPNRYQCLYPWVSPRVTSRCVSRILENPESTSVPVHKLLAHFGGGSVLLGTGWSFFFPGMYL